ncbi:MAG: NUDIX domain-containing protein [Deltaproteobacteria bacterium]|nr:NUDIX domain-containing protein [Deltaproteobacteria bacterium]
MTDKKNTPPPLREASTVILVREKNKTLEIYLLRRSTKSGFMGGLYVFPGGVVDPEDLDLDHWSPHIDILPDQIEKQLGANTFSTEDTLGFSIAAIRETLEEAGVFIASGKDKTQKDIDDICTYRLKRDLPKSWFRTKMINENWTLSVSSLGRWSHWITPKLMKKRFDTRFFLVFMPENQTCVPDNMETNHGIWLTPQNALEQNLEARIPLSPPTVVTLTQLLKFNHLNDLEHQIQTRSWGDPVSPRLVPSSNGPVILEPWDSMYDKDCDIDTSNFSQKVLPPGSQFSRIWCDKGVWKPVGV